MGKLHNYECLVYIFTGKNENGTPIIFNKTLYNFWYKELRKNFSPILINTTHKNVHLKPNYWENYQEWCNLSRKINTHDLCYQCSKYGP